MGKPWNVWRAFAWGAGIGVLYQGTLMTVHSEWGTDPGRIGYAAGALFGGGFILGFIFGFAALLRNRIARG